MVTHDDGVEKDREAEAEVDVTDEASCQSLDEEVRLRKVEYVPQGQDGPQHHQA